MTDGPYRQASAAPARRRVEADESIAASERQLEPLAYVFLPRELRERIAALRAVKPTAEKDGADEAVDDARVELAAVLEEAIDAAKMREIDLQPLHEEHPAGPPLDSLWGPNGTERAAARPLEVMRAAVLDVDPAAEVTRTGATLLARLVAFGAPILWSILLTGELALQVDAEAITFSRSRHWIGIKASTELPKLFIRREGLTDAVLKAIHLRSDVETDDPAFDAAFFVEGNRTFARAVLTEPVREALLGRPGPLELWIDKGAASIEWTSNVVSGLVTEDALAPSVAVLAALHRAIGDLRLIRRA